MGRTAVGWLLAGMVAVQVVVPAVGLLTTDPPRRYAWSMFVASSTTYAYAGERTDGTTRPLDPDQAGFPADAVHYGAAVPRLLCDRNPDLVTVTRTWDGRPERAERC